MYLAYYGLKKEPFHTTPDPSFLFLSPQHKEALGAIIYGIEKRKGFIAIIGEVGVGKTTILRAYLERKASKRQKIVYIFNPVLSYHGLLTAIFRNLEIIPRHDDVTEMVNQLHEALIAEYQAGGTVVLAIDEAQNMPMDTLENLRMISNLESSTDKLIQIILLGQPELNTMLEQPALRQFRQRIALRATISALSEAESRAFIEHRIKLASISQPLILFTKSALNLIVRQAEGIPRRLNILCDNALITGFGRQTKPVPIGVVKEVIKDIDSTETRPSLPYLKWAIGAVAGILLIAGIAFFLDSIPSHVNEVGFKPVVNKIGGQNSGKNTNNAARPLGEEPQQKKTKTIDSSEVPSAPRMIGGKINEGVDEKQRPVEVSILQTNEGAQGQAAEKLNQEKRKTRSSQNWFSRSKDDTEINEFEKAQIRPIQDSIYSKAKSKSVSKVERTIQPGENLSVIASEIYGSQDIKYIEWLKKHNPHIVNPNFILPGQHIVLPEYQN